MHTLKSIAEKVCNEFGLSLSDGSFGVQNEEYAINILLEDFQWALSPDEISWLLKRTYVSHYWNTCREIYNRIADSCNRRKVDVYEFSTVPKDRLVKLAKTFISGGDFKHIHWLSIKELGILVTLINLDNKGMIHP